MRVLICDDNIAVQESVALYLKREEIDALAVSDGETALEELRLHSYDLVVLDIMLPGIDGNLVCQKIREFSDIPILMLSAKGEAEHRITGLELGADDYVTKPFSPKEVAVRIRNMLHRRKKDSEPENLFAAELVINPDTYVTTIKGEKIDFTPREIEVLMYFMKNREQVLTREQILNAIWGYDYEGDTRAVDTQIKRIRRKLPNEELHFHIRALYGVGYKFEVEDETEE